MRRLKTHEVNEANEKIDIIVMDEPGHGGACHEYAVVVDGDSDKMLLVSFQNGPIKEYGVNGITHEVLLAILRDRLEGFQKGDYACEENASALRHIMAAQDILHERTRKRMSRGVEGTHKK